MNRSAYTFCLVKYVHDPSAGEMLNIGVLLFSNEPWKVVGKFESHYDRLSSAFARFNGEHYRAVVRGLEYSIPRLNARFEPSLFESDLIEIKDVFKSLVPDLGLSIQFGPVLAGLTSDLDREAELIFERLILTQAPRKEKKSGTDEEVWAVFNRPLTHRKASKYLKPKHFSSQDYDLKFEHTFNNDRYHILDPVNMHYADAEYLQNRAIKILGQATTLQGNPEIGKLYLLLGEPRLDSHRPAFIKAKNLLNKIPIEKEIVEQKDAEAFANELTNFMSDHGIFEDDREDSDSK